MLCGLFSCLFWSIRCTNIMAAAAHSCFLVSHFVCTNAETRPVWSCWVGKWKADLSSMWRFSCYPGGQTCSTGRQKTWMDNIAVSVFSLKKKNMNRSLYRNVKRQVALQRQGCIYDISIYVERMRGFVTCHFHFYLSLVLDKTGWIHLEWKCIFVGVVFTTSTVRIGGIWLRKMGQKITVVRCRRVILKCTVGKSHTNVMRRWKTDNGRVVCCRRGIGSALLTQQRVIFTVGRS